MWKKRSRLLLSNYFHRVAIVSAITLFLLLSVNPALNAWYSGAHREISNQALNFLPDPLKKALNAHYFRLLAGVDDPDINRVDDHKLYLYNYRWTAPGPGGAHFALDKFARRAEVMIKAGEAMEEIAFVLGQAAHFVHDLNVPLHTIYGETMAEHDAYESVAFLGNWSVEKHYYPGFYLIKNYKCFANEIAKQSHQYFDLALKNPPPNYVIEVTWIDAINDTANLWQSIFYRALGPEKAQELYGIPKPKGEKGKGWFCSY